MPFSLIQNLTFPEGRTSAVLLGAGVTEGLEHRLPPRRGVAPALGLQDEGAAVGVADHHTVHHMVELTAISTALAQVTHYLLSFTAVLRILQINQK